MADKKKTLVEERTGLFFLKSNASVHVGICTSKLTHFRPGEVRLVCDDLSVI